MTPEEVVTRIRELLGSWYHDGDDLVDMTGVVETIADMVFEEDE